ncbi:PAS domain S-box protein [Chryseoglobus sp. 28M-23]|nr:PAS domain S-box protein [Chryseoglobus sp. 28M-23]
MESSPHLIFVLASDWRVTYANAAALRHAGLTPEELSRESVWNLFPALAAPAFREPHERAMVDRTHAVVVEYIEEHQRWLESSIQPLESGLAVQLRDVTREVLSQQRLHSNIGGRQGQNALLDAINDAIIVLDGDGTVRYWNRGAEALYARGRREAIGARIETILTIDDPEQETSAVAELMRAGTWRGEIAQHSHDGRAIVTDCRWQLLDDDEQPGEILCIHTDITPVVSERAAREAEVREHEKDVHSLTKLVRERAALLDVSRDAMIVRDLNHTIRYWNRGAENLYGWTADEAVGRSARSLLYRDTREFDQSCAAVLRDGYWSDEIRERTRDNRIIIGDARWHLLRDDDNRPVAIFAVTSDVTDYRRIEDMRERAQRMESLGTLAGGIAHDLNNVLTPLLLATQVLLADDRSDRDREMLTTIEKSARRGATMIRQMLTFARGVDVERAPIDLADLLAEAHRFARDTLPDSVDILVRHEARHGTLGSTTHLMQVVQNLILNARDAMPDGGTLTLATHSGSPHEPPEHDPLPHAVLEKDHVALSIIDTGVGMRADVIERLWEPFFTTKPLGEGTGLGLPTSAAIIESHDGRISVRSQPGAGTRFDVVLPAAQLAPAPPGRGDDTPPGEGETILLVDDEPLILATTAEALRAHDYHVLTTDDGHEALRMLHEEGESIDLILTDMMMPVMDGASLAAHVAASPHDIPVLAASGLTAGAELMPSATSGITAFLAKPYTVPTLLGAVRLALDGTA